MKISEMGIQKEQESKRCKKSGTGVRSDELM